MAKYPDRIGSRTGGLPIICVGRAENRVNLDVIIGCVVVGRAKKKNTILILEKKQQQKNREPKSRITLRARRYRR